MDSISVMIKPISGQCNMKCSYCFYKDELKFQHKHNPIMSDSTLENVIKKVLSCSVKYVFFCFQGGEPLLREIDFYRRTVQLQKKWNKTGIHVFNSIQTNGLLLNEEWCSFFKENDFWIGISVDGIRETHDQFRCDLEGKGTFDRIVLNIELLKQKQVNFNVLTVVNKETVRSIEEIYSFYKEMKINNQQYIICRPLFEHASNETEYQLDSQSYGKFLCRLFELWKEDRKNGVEPYIRQFDNYLRIFLGMSPENCEQRGNCGCMYVIESDGSTYPCDFYMLNEHLLGNINTNTIAELDEVRQKKGFIKKSTLLSEKCRKCNYLLICRSGCQRNRIWEEQNKGYLNLFCKGYYHFFEKNFETLKRISESIWINQEKKKF